MENSLKFIIANLASYFSLTVSVRICTTHWNDGTSRQILRPGVLRWFYIDPRMKVEEKETRWNHDTRIISTPPENKQIFYFSWKYSKIRPQINKWK